MERLLIAIDPGYDQYKVAVNDTWFAFPSTIIQVEKEHQGLGKKDGSFYYYSNDGRIFLFGTAAENELGTTRSVEKNKDLLMLNKGEERFQSGYFKFTLEAALAYSLFLYETSEEGKDAGFHIKNLDKYQIFFGVALPHASLEKDLPSITDYLLCKHNFSFHVAGQMDAPEEFKFDLSNAEITGNSQAICAFLHYTLNDDLSDAQSSNDLLPCVVYDAGYKTVGRFLLNENLHIYDAESNMEFAMYNVYQGVADEINKKIPDKHFEAYRVQKYIKSERKINGSKTQVDPKPIYDKMLKDICKKACEDLSAKWNDDLEDSKLFLLAGGTGAAYYNEFKTYLNEHYPYLNVVLNDKKYNGKEIEPIFSICLGMMKYMRMNLSEMD